MEIASSRNLISLAMAAVLLMAATTAGTALFSSDSPGLDLIPRNGAEEMVQILQGNQTILWTSLSGPVTETVTRGWPSKSGDVELGGGLVVEKPDNPYAGDIAFGEKPMSVEFRLGG